MFSVAPNIVLVPNMTQNTERKHRTQDTNTAPIRPQPKGILAIEDVFSLTAKCKTSILFHGIYEQK